MKRLSTFLLALLLTWIGASAQSSWTAPVLQSSTLSTEGGKYYLFNTEAKQYACEGTYKWGTNAIFGDNGLLFTLASASTTDYDGATVTAYTLTSSAGQFFWDGEYIYCDGSSKTTGIYFVFTETSTGSKVYKIHGTYATTDTYIGYDPATDTKNGYSAHAVLPALAGTEGQGIEWELYAEDAEELHNALVILYNTLVHAESYGMTDSDDAYKEAGEVYLSSTATVDGVMEAVAALEEAMEAYATVADPDDVTYAFITNPNFDTDITGWTGNFGHQTTPHSNGDITIDGYAESWTNSNSSLQAKTFYQTLSGLSKGIYRLEVDAIATQQGDARITVTGVNLYAGTQKTPMHSANGLPEHFTVNFEVADESGTVNIGVEVTSDNNANWVAVDNFRLYYLGAEYEAGDEVHGCEAEFGHWTITDHATGLFQHNTWSTEDDPSEMKTPFIEYWIGSGKELEDATISHYTITGEPGEIYAVSIDYRAFNENSDKKVSQGSTFTANDTSFDLCVGTRSVFQQTDQEDSQEEYAIGYTILCKADATTGAIDVKFDIKDADFDWFAFKDLSIALFDGTSWPTLTAATGDMHTGYADAQTTALSAYNSSPSFDTYLAAFNAVNAAQLSALFYSDIAEALTELSLDEAGTAAFYNTKNGAAYEAKTLEYCDMTGTYITAEASQAVGTKLVYAVNNTKWICEQGNGPTKMDNGYETYSDTSYKEGKIMYQLLENLPEGYTYQVQFRCFSKWANIEDGAAGSNIAQAYANEQADAIDVINAYGDYSSNNTNDLEDGDYLHTFTVTVGSDGQLEYGIKNVGTGGNWVMAEIVSITITAVGITWEMTSAGYGTLILPFDATLPTQDNEGNEITWTAYSTGTVTLDDDESGNATLSLTEESSAIKANTPYIMAGTAGKYTFTGTPQTDTNNLTEGKLTGTYETMDYTALMAAAGENTVYLLQNHDGTGEDGVAFYPVVEDESSAAILTPYHCYLTLTENDLKTTSGAPARLSFSFGGEATGIVAVEGAEAEGNGAIYDLSGRKVSKAVKGVYIQNGKKVLVK